ncbi:MAG: formimidoylglutamase [Planctomycetota bacterium]
MKLEHVTRPVWPERRLGSFASTIQLDGLSRCEVALLGLPDDTGVRMNGGHPGAADGPRTFREAIVRYGVAEPHGFAWPTVFDAGDVQAGDSLEDTHERVSAISRELTERGMTVVGIGGGHDLTWPLVRGVLSIVQPLDGVYFDAHLDVRAETGSGMPFRKLLEHPGVTSLEVIGLDPFANSAKHVAWFEQNGGRVRETVPNDPWPAGDLFVSFDLDSIDASHAPGVSARNPCGMSAHAASRWVRAAGRHGGVRCFDIMELCPPHDKNGRTARLAAHLFLSFLRGIADRTLAEADEA